MEKFAKFMIGRYGTYARGFDTLGKWTVIAALVLSFAAAFIPVFYVRIAVSVLSLLLFGWTVFRFLSKNINARVHENMRFIRILDSISIFFGGKTDGDKKIYRCPKCHTKVRVPKGKGKIRITCPKCGRQFVKKT